MAPIQGGWLEPLPPLLQGAHLLLSERKIATDVPVPLHGQVDQVFLARGWLILVDTKRRKQARVFAQNVIQLSVYATILARQASVFAGQNYPVASTAFIRCVTPHGTTYIEVSLLSTREIIALWNWYWMLGREGLAARPTCPSPPVCAGCSKKTQCPRGKWLGNSA